MVWIIFDKLRTRGVEDQAGKVPSLPPQERYRSRARSDEFGGGGHGAEGAGREGGESSGRRAGIR